MSNTKIAKTLFILVSVMRSFYSNFEHYAFTITFKLFPVPSKPTCVLLAQYLSINVGWLWGGGGSAGDQTLTVYFGAIYNNLLLGNYS